VIGQSALAVDHDEIRGMENAGRPLRRIGSTARRRWNSPACIPHGPEADSSGFPRWRHRWDP
jgi:hypothetical protein